MNKQYLQKLAKRIKEIRTSKNMVQDDLASENVSRGMISLLETGRTDVTVTKLKYIADSLGVKVKELFDFE
ncbi:MAG: helix-turn-helix domain-containing protein [Candidatus Gastranaerophilaceae bacterium]